MQAGFLVGQWIAYRAKANGYNWVQIQIGKWAGNAAARVITYVFLQGGAYALAGLFATDSWMFGALMGPMGLAVAGVGSIL